MPEDRVTREVFWNISIVGELAFYALGLLALGLFGYGVLRHLKAALGADRTGLLGRRRGFNLWGSDACAGHGTSSDHVITRNHTNPGGLVAKPGGRERHLDRARLPDRKAGSAAIGQRELSRILANQGDGLDRQDSPAGVTQP